VPVKIIKMNKHLENKALKYFGKAYICLPRKIVDRQLNPSPTERNIGFIHFVMFCKCNYEWSTSSTLCGIEKKGEWITTYDQISRIASLPVKTVRRCVRVLLLEELIESDRIGRYTLFRVCGYKPFVRAAGNSCPSAPEASGRHPYTPEELESLRIAREGRSRQDLLDYSSCINREYYEEF